MENFWTIVARWEPLGQWIFFLLVLVGLSTLLRKLVYYGAVMLRGWPKHPEPEDYEE